MPRTLGQAGGQRRRFPSWPAWVICVAIVLALLCTVSLFYRQVYTLWLLRRLSSESANPVDLLPQFNDAYVDRLMVFGSLGSTTPAPAFRTYAGPEAEVRDAIYYLTRTRESPSIFPTDLVPSHRDEARQIWRHAIWHQYLSDADRLRFARSGDHIPCSSDRCTAWRDATNAWIQAYDRGRFFGDPLTIDPLQ